MSATSIDLSQIKTDALSAASTFRTLIGLGTSAVLNAGSANGVATLGADSKLTAAQIPDISLISYLGSVASQAAMLALTGQQGDWCVRSDLSTTWVITGSDPTQIGNWTQLSYPSVPVQSVFGRTGAVVGVSTDYSSVGITNTAIGASNPSTGAFTELSVSNSITTTASAAPWYLGRFRNTDGAGIGFAGSGDPTIMTANGLQAIAFAQGIAKVWADFAFTWCEKNNDGSLLKNVNSDLYLLRDAAGTLAQRNDTNKQRFNLYGTYTNASNYRRLYLDSTTAGAFTIGVEGAGTGVSGNTLTIANATSFSNGITTPTISLSGNVSSTAWTTSGVGLSHTARTLTDTSSTGTVATAYTNVLGGNTIAASNATTFTDYASLFLGSPSAGTNVTITNPFSLITQGAARFGGAVGVSAGTLNGTVLDIAQTWGGTGTYTGLRYNVTDSGPANAASLLMDLQVGGTTQFRVRKDGAVLTPRLTLYSNPRIDTVNVSTQTVTYVGYAHSFRMGESEVPRVQVDPVSGLGIGIAAGGGMNNGAWLINDAANTLAQRNGTSAQALRIYNTTDAGLTNYERAKIAWESNVLVIGTEALGTGSNRNIRLQSSTNTLTLDTGGYLTMAASLFFSWSARTTLGAPSAGVLRLVDDGGGSNPRIVFQGTTSSFPAIKRNSAALNFRLADDSADCDITAKAATFSGNVTVSAVNLVTDTTTGTKIGTGTTQKLGFYNSTPVVQPAAVADATDAASVITQLNLLLARMRDLGLIAT